MKTVYSQTLKLTLLLMALINFRSLAKSEQLNFSGTFKSVEITELKAELVEGNAIIHLEVSDQIQNAFFTVEKTSDLQNWSEIGIIPGSGTSNHSEIYEYIDSKLEEGTFYYRIKMTDFNGNFSYSSVCALEIKFVAKETIVYPVPASQVLNIHLSNQWEDTVSIQILDISGVVYYNNDHFI